MSGTLAIAAVSAVMKSLLLNSLSDYGVTASVVPSLKISALPPDKVVDDQPCLNIFFYRAITNSGWAANDLPSRNERGESVTNPYLALDLDYLLTAHGTKDFQGEILLGYAMQIFHEKPVLARQAIRDALRPSAPGSPNPLVNADTPESMLAAIAAAELADQIEQIKIAPYNHPLDEVSNVWSSLQTQYRPTAAYKVSVVLIRSKRPSRVAPPVKDYKVYAMPFRQPVIEEVFADDGPGTPILMNKNLVLRGQALRGADTRVNLGGIELSGAALQVTDERIELALPVSARAGIQGVQVKHYLSLGVPPQPHRGFESNVAAFVLQPQITKTGPNYNLDILPAAGDLPRRLRVQLNPAVDATQRAELMLNEPDAPDTRPARTYTIEAIKRAPGSPATTQLEFPLTGVEADEYLVRVQVDGAQSPLDFVAPQGYVGPKVNL